jgi:hypothetical protein
MSTYDCLKVYQSPYPKHRIGRDNDGGYVICDIDQDYDILISGGVADDISFEMDLLNQYPHLLCHTFDGSVNQIPDRQLALTPNDDQWIPVKDRTNEWIQIGNKCHSFCTLHCEKYGPPTWGSRKDCSAQRKYLGIMVPQLTLISNPYVLTWAEAVERYSTLASAQDVMNYRRISFFKKFLGNHSDQLTSNLREYLDHNENIFMKLDIEGGEKSLFSSFTDNDLKKIKQLVIEFHDPYSVELQERLAKTHWLIHLHPNNVGHTVTIGDIVVPELYECTYVRKRTDEQLPQSTENIPTNIDQPNVGCKSDIILDSYPYRQT